MGAVRAYRRLLGNRHLTRLLLGEFVSGIGDWLYIVAILVVVYRQTGDAALVGLFGAVRQVPYVLLSIPAGVLADRFDRRLVLLVTDLLRAACMLGMAAVVVSGGPLLFLVALSVVATCGSTFFYPAIGAYIPALARDERELGPANGAWASLDNLGFVIGPVLGGLLIATGEVALAFVINAATFLVIAAVLWTLPPSVAASTERPTDSSSDAGGADGSSPGRPAVLRRSLAGLLLVEFAANVVAGGVTVLTVVLAVEVLRAGEAATGYLNAAIGVGGVTGAVVAGVLVLRRSLAVPLLGGAIAITAGSVLLGIAPGLLVAMVAIVVVFVGRLVIEVVATTLLQRVTTDAIRGRATGVFMTVAVVGEITGAIALAALVVAGGPAFALVTAGVVTLAAAAVGLVLVGSALTRPRSPFEGVLARATELPLFAGVPPSSLERALSRLVPVEVPAGHVVIREGDPADRFYLVASGSLLVTQRTADGSVRELRRLGPDAAFGELGLLTGSPRTATVTAETDATLAALDAPAFLELVGGGGSLRSRLLGLYAAPAGGEAER